MNTEELQKYTENETISINQAMQKIDANAHGILFLLNDNGSLSACITDGDIRRWLLAGGKLEDDADKAANHSPKHASNLTEAKKLYHKRNWIAIPIIDTKGILKDIYTGDGEGDKKQRERLNVPVVINAGGRGTRLDPFTKVLPKPLIPVGELPIIELIMQEYQSYSCNAFHIIVNYKKELIKTYFAENERKYDITWHDEEEPLGTGGGLSLLKGKLDSTFFFANCDALLTANYKPMLEFHKKGNNAITMICVYKNISIPYVVVEMGEGGVYESMKEKPLMSFLTNTGIYIVEPIVLEDMKEGEAIGFPEVIERQRQKGRKVAVYPVSENNWMDMGQFDELEKMRKKLYGE